MTASEAGWLAEVLGNDDIQETISDRYSLLLARLALGTCDDDPVFVGRDDRYTLERRLGQGGMGEVYLAHDNLLKRRVALKVLATHHRNSPALHQRMFREAEALAHVRHPNVLEIYDIETSASGELFMTMAYVDGSDLHEWQREQPLRAVVTKYVEAGRGLAAAHASGVVHRDFKPSNVLIDDDGVYVADFGLASLLGAEDEAVRTPDAGTLEPSTPEPGSKTGLVGTLLYAAPEVLAGRGGDRASDQYAFCVALWEGVTKRPPFADERARAPTRPAAMPRWLHRILCRGLAFDPQARYPSVDALVIALERGLRRRARLGVAALLVTVMGVGVGLTLASVDAPPSCASAAAAIDGVWNEQARAHISARLADADGEGIWVTRYTLAVLDSSAEQWRQASLAACTAQTSDPSSRRALLQRACLDERLEQFQRKLQQLDELGTASSPTISSLLDSLTLTAARCELPAAVLSADARARLESIDLALAERDLERALVLAQDLERGASSWVEPCVEGEVHYSLERGEARYRIARIHGIRESPNEAIAAIVGAVVDAEACGGDELRARCYVLQSQVEALDLERPQAAASSLEAGIAVFARLGGFGALEWQVHQSEAFVALAQGEPQAAVHAYEAAIDSLGDELATQPLRAKLMADLGVAAQEAGEDQRAELAHQRAVALVSAALGPQHPESLARRGQALLNMALIADARGDEVRVKALLGELLYYDDPALTVRARTLLLRTLLLEDIDPEDDHTLARALAFDLARAHHLPARVHAEGHVTLGQAFARVGDPLALDHLQLALSLWTAIPDADLNLDACQLNYAEALAAAGVLEAAREQLTSFQARVTDGTNEVLRQAAVDLMDRLDSAPGSKTQSEPQARGSTTKSK